MQRNTIRKNEILYRTIQKHKSILFQGNQVDEEAIVRHLFTIGEVALVSFVVLTGSCIKTNNNLYRICKYVP